MIHPEYQLLQNEGDIVMAETLTPIYPATEGLSQTRLRQIINTALTLCAPTIAQNWNG